MKIVVIGAVAAGMSAASKARRIDKTAQVVVFEKGENISYGACGLPYYVAGLNDDCTKMLVRSKEQFRAQGIDVRTQMEVLAVDALKKQLTVQDGQTGTVFAESYDRLMIATGAEALRPPLPGMDLPGVYTLKSLEDGLTLQGTLAPGMRVLVVGGGAIGVELAESLAGQGWPVRFIEAADRILPPYDREISDKILWRMREAGIDVRLGEPVQAVLEQNGRAAGVRTAAGEYAADLVVMALGVRPATAFLWDTGVAMAPNGAIEVDRQQRTSLPDVWAAGDCAMTYDRVQGRYVYYALGTVANKCGRIAGENLAGGHAEFDGALGSAMIAVCGIEAARTGLSEDEARALYGDVGVVMVEDSDHPPYYPNPKPLWVKLIYEKKTKRLLGGQTLGENGAALRMQALAVAISAGMTTGELGYLDLGYAPPFAKAWDGLNIAGNAAK